MKSFQQASDYLASLSFRGMKLGLANVRRLLERLDNPSRAFGAIHVAGTNGKGSTCAMIANILTRAGIPCGMYVSPHLETFLERIQVNGEMIAPEQVAPLVDEVRRAAEGEKGLNPTYFEFMTAMAFLHFRNAGVKLAALEVGLGGRFDATNVVTPAVSVITSIGMDHMEHLGDTIESIAAEKCGVIKPGRPVVTGVEEGGALDVARRAALARKSPLSALGADFTAVRRGMTPWGERFDYSSPAGELTGLEVSLAGPRQVNNAAVTLRVMELLRAEGYSIPESATREGLAAVSLPGRFERARTNPLVILDGAHNPQSAGALRDAAMERFGPKSMVIVFGAMRDKDYGSMLELLAPLARSFICYTPPVERAADPADLAAAQNDPAIPTSVARTMDELMAALDSLSRDAVILCTGSFYTIGAIRGALRAAPFHISPKTR